MSDDDDGQVDGDEVYPFARGMQAQPWMRGNTPPWHMWGSQETLVVRSGVAFSPILVSSQQLSKVNYKRPETWHWLFFARLIEAPDAGLAEQGAIVINFDVTVGIGRSSVTLPGFENFSWVWGPSAAPPLAQQLWSTESIGPVRNVGGLTPLPSVIDELVAQDIQVQARVQNNSNFATSVRVELASFFAPKNHIRPDWFRDGVEELQYAGAEVEGR